MEMEMEMKMKMKKKEKKEKKAPDLYYKIVTLDRGDLISCWIRSEPYMLKYKVRKWTYSVPGSMGIMVFDSEINAQMFRAGLSMISLQIYSCEVIGPRIPEWILLTGGCYCGDLLRQLKPECLFDKGKMPDISSLPSGISAPPTGTVCCSAVKLLKEIKS